LPDRLKRAQQPLDIKASADRRAAQVLKRSAESFDAAAQGP
jgi:hypothetical protein